MTATEFWMFLHISAMFLAVSIFVGQGMLSGVVARSGDVRALRRVLAIEDRFSPIGGAVFILGIVFGLITAIVGDYDLTQAWLVIGYVLTALILVNAFAYHVPTAKKLKALADASPEDEASPELQAYVAAGLGRVMNAIDSLLWLAIIFVMVVKPFS